MERVLVTGATGFIGRHVMALLASDTRFMLVGSARRVTEFAPDNADLANRAEADALLSRVRPTAIIHAAGSRHATRQVLETSNVVTTRHVIAAAGTLDHAPRIVLLGSAAEYGPQATDGPVSEDAPCQPRSDYGRSKLEATIAALRQSETLGMALTVLRPFNVVGKGMGGLPGDVVRQLDGTGPQLDWDRQADSLPMVRDFVRVADVAEACRRALLATSLPPVINICTGHGRSYAQLLAEMATIAGRELGQPPCNETADQSIGDPTLCERSLGFRPSADIGDMLADALANGRRAA